MGGERDWCLRKYRRKMAKKRETWKNTGIPGGGRGTCKNGTGWYFYGLHTPDEGHKLLYGLK